MLEEGAAEDSHPGVHHVCPQTAYSCTVFPLADSRGSEQASEESQELTQVTGERVLLAAVGGESGSSKGAENKGGDGDDSGGE